MEDEILQVSPPKHKRLPAQKLAIGSCGIFDPSDDA